jgi:hypothetical protein
VPYLQPKLSATAVLHTDDFATALERAITRSMSVKLIEASALPKQGLRARTDLFH